MYSQQFGTIIQPQTYERSYSPLLTEPQEEEGWKVSTLLQHVANHQDSYTRNEIQMSSIDSTAYSPSKKRKPLPELPTLYTTLNPHYQANQAAYYPYWQHDLNNYYAGVPCTPISAGNLDPNVMYNHQYQQQQQQPYMETNDVGHLSSSSSSFIEPEDLSSANDSPVSPSLKLQQHLPKFEQNKNVRQITVKSINDDYRVWITVEPKETGESIAEKIHVIATFRTRKITSVTTASGRKIPLNKTPVFKNWEDMDDFEHGETWTVTWGPLKKSFMDKVFSKFIET
ncbi:hypothetical protein PS15m_005041 [Mucor circinelloides]